MPINLKIEKTIVENAHLINGSGMPKEFRDVLVHVEAYKTTIKKWEEEDFTNHVSYNNYPRSFLNSVSHTYADLKKKQAKMIGMK